MNKQFWIEYEIPPMRGIYHLEMESDSEENVKTKFMNEKPRAKIRKIEVWNRE